MGESRYLCGLPNSASPSEEGEVFAAHRAIDTRPEILPPHEPQGRARLSPARRAADAKWKRRARDRREPRKFLTQPCNGNRFPSGRKAPSGASFPEVKAFVAI